MRSGDLFQSLLFSLFFKMSTSAAIASADFEALKAVVEGKDNEVFDTTLFDSYDDKRIEELLLLEAVNFIKETELKSYEFKYELDSIKYDICEKYNNIYLANS